MTKEHKVEKFDPYKHLRHTTEYFLHREKIVGERVKLQCLTPGETCWYDIPTHEEYKTIIDLEHLEDYYSNVELRPGIKEKIEEIRNEEDDD